jgi:hypothetical protein
MQDLMDQVSDAVIELADDLLECVSGGEGGMMDPDGKPGGSHADPNGTP